MTKQIVLYSGFVTNLRQMPNILCSTAFLLVIIITGILSGLLLLFSFFARLCGLVGHIINYYGNCNLVSCIDEKTYNNKQESSFRYFFPETSLGECCTCNVTQQLYKYDILSTSDDKTCNSDGYIEYGITGFLNIMFFSVILTMICVVIYVLFVAIQNIYKYVKSKNYLKTEYLPVNIKDSAIIYPDYLEPEENLHISNTSMHHEIPVFSDIEQMLESESESSEDCVIINISDADGYKK